MWARVATHNFTASFTATRASVQRYGMWIFWDSFWLFFERFGGKKEMERNWCFEMCYIVIKKVDVYRLVQE